MTTSTQKSGSIVPALVAPLWKSSLISGLLAIILGALILYRPSTAVFVTALLFAIYLFISGIAQIVFAFALDAGAGSRVLMFISGAASIVLGFMALRSFDFTPRAEGDGGLTAVMLLSIWIGIGFIFRGVATAVSAISDPTLPGRGWQIFFGVISLIAGIVMMAWPGLSLLTLLMVVGWYLIFIGVFEIVGAFVIRRETKTHTG